MESQLLYFLIAIIIGFICLIYFLLKHRKSLLEKSLHLTSSEVWKTIENHSIPQELAKENLIYGIIQDHSFSESVLIFRNFQDEEIGQAFFPARNRQRKLIIGNQNYTIKFPLRWNNTAVLLRDKDQQIIATYVKTDWTGNHEFEIPNEGKLISNRRLLSISQLCHYSFKDNFVGTIQNISKTHNLGRLAILSDSIPLEVRLFMLSI